MSVVDFISVQECLGMAGSDWYSLPKWIVEKYDNGYMIFLHPYISYHINGDKKMAYTGQYMVLSDDNILSVEDDVQFIKIR